MKINDNAIVREMTAEEIAEMERLQAESPPVPTDDNTAIWDALAKAYKEGVNSIDKSEVE